MIKSVKYEKQKITLLPLAPDVVIRDIQFFPIDFTKPSDNSSARTPWLEFLLSTPIIFLSKADSAASPSLRMFLSIFNCNSVGAETDQDIAFVLQCYREL